MVAKIILLLVIAAFVYTNARIIPIIRMQLMSRGHSFTTTFFFMAGILEGKVDFEAEPAWVVEKQGFGAGCGFGGGFQTGAHAQRADDFERRDLFSRHEIAEIVKQLRKFEYRLKRPNPPKKDFLAYIDYEKQLDALRLLALSKNSVNKKSKRIHLRLHWGF
ncbi:unnamed protein product [Fraxinus pennsylvanica]|uniref:U3 small nucleolar RNA-associated protein 6 N-terminal domain-containing protein n=1 Tax=Fraxinus pennsylvanica TaxID=56036 RepID=A0AAD2A6S7_9LAMI|nr:unnamed protein product [Fraxinus pennsylvanica]